MFLIGKLLCFIRLNLIIASLQINLHLTDDTSNDVAFQHHCLYIPVSVEDEMYPFQIISYCLSEQTFKWNIEVDNHHEKFTFIELYKRNITSEQLYMWSAPIDVIEDYQLFLNQILASDNSLMISSSSSSQRFYNCTLPRFGSLCQYSLDIDNSQSLSLNELVNKFYQQAYSPKTLTCYTHLKCNRGLTMMCLDWTEICDGYIDCLNDGIDEENCWSIQINQCRDDEYRCYNGQCISKIFARDNPWTHECLDLSDESNHQFMPLPLSSAAPTFVTEDIQCSIKHPMFNIRLTSSCVYDRQNLLRQIILSHTPNSFSETCWSAFQCFNQTCKQIIDDTCPDLLFVPYEAFIFGHIHLLYLKKSIMNLSTSFLPQYICYNDQLCHGFLSNVTLLKFNNITCRRFEDFPLKTPLIPHKNWFDLNLRLLYDQLHHCNTILYDKPFICNSSTMYRCIKSSKCISQYQLCDDIYDCDYKDDEQCSLTNDICSIYDSISLFKCPLMNKCISRKKVQNRYCDCGFDEFGLCEDESSVTRHIREHISFPTICDGFTELKPVLIDGRNETDETECTYWQCDNIYTRCNGIWNCLNGADEVNCHSFIECPLNHHLCISPSTYQFICLPLEKAHDGNIDCVAGIDEPKLCRMNNYKVHDWQFYCQDNPIQSCTSFKRLCSEKQNCTYGNHDVLCINSEHMSSYLATCDSKWVRNATKLQKFLCRSFNDQNKNPFGYFSLMNFQQSIEHITPKTRMIAVAKPQYAQHCHRGLPLRVWLTNNDKNLTEKICLCPPSFYGDICQYQNQRVSLTLKFETYSNSRQTLFAMIVSLIDDSYERIVHSYEQFTYLYIGHCQKKFNIYLLYSARPKSLTRNYSIHIDIYEKISLVYRSSHIIPLQHPFLPVHRIALQLQIPNSDISSQHCSIHQHCIHGQCMSYINDEDNSSFCQCYSGWSGKYCTIRQSCTCSSESLCIGMTATNRSICVCPRNRWGPRCLLQSTSCPSNTCLNHGQCISIDDNIISDQQFICICLKGFRGKRCEIIDYKLIISFQEKIPFPQPILVHFFEIRNDSSPINGSTFRTVLPYQKTITIYWSHPFHIVLLERSDRNLYLISVEHIWNQSTSLVRTMKFSNRCQHINEVFNKTITHLHLLRRIKYYHLPCQSSSPIVSCFYDDTHFCLCNHFNHHRVANCFEFNFTIKHNCYDQSSCENQAQCIQDRFVCPQTSICVCPKCFYGTRCQFSSNLFDLSLDTILSYHIQPHVNILNQSSIIQVSIVLTSIIILVALINGILSFITFKNKETQKIGSGIYLYACSMITLFVTIIFTLKFSIFLIVQISSITNRTFLMFQCCSMDFFLRIALNMNQWLHACVAIERIITIMKGTSFNIQKSKQMARYIIFVLFVFILITSIHDPIHRRLLYNVDFDEEQEERIWCIVTYSSNLQIFNLIVNIFHFFTPFCINFLSAIIIMIKTDRQRKRNQTIRTYLEFIYKQFRRHIHLVFASILLTLLAIPRLIIALTSICLTSNTNPWLIISGYYISFIPSILTFILFVIPSKFYRKEFYKTIERFRRKLQHQIHPL